MPVLINYKICDNSQDCSGIQECPKGAFRWDHQNRSIAVNELECTLCGACEEACPEGAIRVASTEAEYLKIKKEIDEDPRKLMDLFVDRYGAQPIQEAFLGEQEKFEIQIIQSTKLIAVEFYKPDSIRCLVSSIPVQELFETVDWDLMYRKIEIKDDSILETYGVNTLPALLFFNNGKLLDKIEGYYDNTQKSEVIDEIKRIAIKTGVINK